MTILNEIQFLLEMPRLIGDLEWHDLYHSDLNHQWYLKYNSLSFKKKISLISSDVVLYNIGTQFVALNHTKRSVSYYVSVKVKRNNKLGQYAWQCLVWADANEQSIRGLASAIFFDYILAKYETVLTDSHQTWDGHRFWLLRISDAFKLGHKVGYYNFSKNELIMFSDFSEWEKFNSTHSVWGTEPNMTVHRYLIKK